MNVLRYLTASSAKELFEVYPEFNLFHTVHNASFMKKDR